MIPALDLPRLIDSLRTQADDLADAALGNIQGLSPSTNDEVPMIIINGTASVVLYSLVIALQASLKEHSS
jgi:hypothetical protein